jgi:hypothetical protein
MSAEGEAALQTDAHVIGSGQVRIDYSVPVSGPVLLDVFDVAGRRMATLVDRIEDAGSRSVTWKASDAPSGIYLYRFTAGAQSLTGRMIVLR